MAAFVVISTDNRLSGLVDGIEKCLPLNPNVGTYISTGKIEKEGDSYFYKYQINKEGNGGNETGDFSNLVLNQLSAFKRAYGVGNTLLNVFMLENPRTEEELQLLEIWLNGFERLFIAKGLIAVQNIHIYRVLLTYDVEKPDDVTSQLSPDILKSYLERRDKYAFKDSSSILCISNRDKDEAAISFGRKEHDIKLPRLLADFMMLLSSANNAYGVFNAINPPNSSERCFSLGYAESMYYFPDVREYYSHADMRSLYERILKDPDEAAQLDDDEEAMNIEHHPLGLNNRRKWLTGKYADVPFDQDIRLYEGSADFIVDDCLQKLKALFCRKREEEIERKKRDVDSKIAGLKAGYNSMSQENSESEDEFNARKSDETRREAKALQDELNRFIDDFPQFISREEIYDHVGGYEDEKTREDYLKNAEEQYGKLVAYAKGNDFFDYVKTFDASCNNQQVVIPNNLQDNPSCWFKFWGREKQEVPSPTPPPAPSPMLLKNVKEIRKQLELKKTFEKFLSKRNEIEQAMKDEEEWCKKFKLTDHSHHYYHLIDLPKLKGYQKEKFNERFQPILKQWNADEDNRNLTQLKELLSQNTETYTEKLKYIDWNEPFHFVSDTSDTELADVCSRLYEKSSPFVHYEKVTATAQDPITYALYSDIPDIEKRFKGFKNNVTNSTNIIPHHSTHISSKLCFFQFLPLDKEALDKLCETKEDSTTAHDNEGVGD